SFDVLRSAFSVRRSAFGVQRSAFGVRRSAFWRPEPRTSNNEPRTSNGEGRTSNDERRLHNEPSERRPFEDGAIPARERRGLTVGAVDEGGDRLLRRVGPAYGLVRQDELAELAVIEGTLRLHPRRFQARRLRHRVGI